MNDLRKAAEIALAHLESISDWDCTYPIGKAKDALRQALAQPEQEPVAWIHTRCGHPLYLSFQYHAEDVPLYTAPPSIEAAVLAEREACAKLIEADGLARGDEGLVFIKAAGRIWARGDK